MPVGMVNIGQRDKARPGLFNEARTYCIQDIRASGSGFGSQVTASLLIEKADREEG